MIEYLDRSVTVQCRHKINILYNQCLKKSKLKFLENKYRKKQKITSIPRSASVFVFCACIEDHISELLISLQVQDKKAVFQNF